MTEPFDITPEQLGRASFEHTTLDDYDTYKRERVLQWGADTWETTTEQSREWHREQGLRALDIVLDAYASSILDTNR